MKLTPEETVGRLEDLEIRMAFLEKGLSELDEVVRQIGDQMEFTQQAIRQMREQIQADALTIRGDAMDEVPPHY